MAPFNGHWPSSLLMSQDPVAIDSVGLDFLREEFGLVDHADNHLHEAALMDNAPSGITYMPDGVAVTESQGTHEHWNNPNDKLYSRNLATGEGIALVTSFVDDDTTPPGIPGNLAGTSPSYTRIDLTWNAASDAETGITAYKIYRDGVLAGTSTSTNFTDEGLTEGTTYDYQVAAVNGAGMEGTACPAVPVTTLADPDPPTVVDVRFNVGYADPTGQEQRSEIRNIEVAFSEDMDPITATDLALTNLGVDASAGNETPVDLSSAEVVHDGDTLTITFPPTPDVGKYLADGVYELVISGSVTDTAGTPLDGDGDGTGGDPYVLTGNETNEFYSLAGDFNGTAGVNIFDFFEFRTWFGQDVPPAPEYVDLNASGGVNIFDFFLFQENFGNSITFPSASAPLSATTTDGQGGVAFFESIVTDAVEGPAEYGAAGSAGEEPIARIDPAGLRDVAIGDLGSRADGPAEAAFRPTDLSWVDGSHREAPGSRSPRSTDQAKAAVEKLLETL
jgi:hypothetical protein